tara:strand:- start:127 stop:408 length:282 start_codon:yes stop_codon:yes gene_type:complete
VSYKLKVLKVVDKPDGTSELIIDLPEGFKEYFKETQGLKRWSSKRFEKWLVESLTALFIKENNVNVGRGVNLNGSVWIGKTLINNKDLGNESR